MFGANATQTNANTHAIGPHHVEDHGARRLNIALIGDVTGAHAEQLARLAGELSAGQGLYVLADLRRMGKVGSDARTAFQEGLKDLPVGAVGIVGLNAAIRTLAKVAFRAVNLLKREKIHVGFFKHPADAARWLDQR